jgi:hypothetical protein
MLYCNQITGGIWLECHGDGGGGGGDDDDDDDGDDDDDSDDTLLSLNLTLIKGNYYVQFQSCSVKQERKLKVNLQVSLGLVISCLECHP